MRKYTTILASFAISGALVACSPAETGEAAAEEDAVEEVEVIDDAMEEHGNDDRRGADDERGNDDRRTEGDERGNDDRR
jgi:hypothetical protein